MNIKLPSVPMVLTIMFLGFPPQTRAVVPAPDGGYPGGNTAEGQAALFNLSSGGYNTAAGFASLRSDSTGSFNTAVGAGALFANNGDYNTATGVGALLSNTSGIVNTANGAFALFTNTDGGYNVAIGSEALYSNTTGTVNVAVGESALFHNTIGIENTAIGDSALTANTTGVGNTAVGDATLVNNDAGDSNTAIGAGALEATVNDNNTAVGAAALISNTTGSNNTALGVSAGSNLTTGDNNIDIGYNVVGVDGENNTTRIGNTDITTTIIRGISGATITSGSPVLVAANGQLGTMTSSKRFKQNIKPMDKASEAIYSLEPVTFRYKKEIDPTAVSQFGLVAEEVEKVNPDLVVRDEEGKVYSVRYDQVNAMLLNEFLKEHRKVHEQACEIEQQKAKISELEKAMETIIAHSKEQDVQIQRVGRQVQMSTAEWRTLASKQ